MAVEGKLRVEVGSRKRLTVEEAEVGRRKEQDDAWEELPNRSQADVQDTGTW